MEKTLYLPFCVTELLHEEAISGGDSDNNSCSLAGSVLPYQDFMTATDTQAQAQEQSAHTDVGSKVYLIPPNRRQKSNNGFFQTFIKEGEQLVTAEKVVFVQIEMGYKGDGTLILNAL